MHYIFLSLIIFLIALAEPLIGLLFTSISSVLPPLVVWIFLWIFISSQDKRYFFVLITGIGLVLDSIEQTLLGFHANLTIISIVVSVWAIRSFIDKSNFKYPAIVVVAGLIYYGGEVLYRLISAL